MQDSEGRKFCFLCVRLLSRRKTDASDIKQSHIHISASNIELTDMISAMNLYFQ